MEINGNFSDDIWDAIQKEIEKKTDKELFIILNDCDVDATIEWDRVDLIEAVRDLIEETNSIEQDGTVWIDKEGYHKIYLLNSNDEWDSALKEYEDRVAAEMKEEKAKKEMAKNKTKIDN